MTKTGTTKMKRTILNWFPAKNFPLGDVNEILLCIEETTPPVWVAVTTPNYLIKKQLRLGAEDEIPRDRVKKELRLNPKKKIRYVISGIFAFNSQKYLFCGENMTDKVLYWAIPSFPRR